MNKLVVILFMIACAPTALHAMGSKSGNLLQKECASQANVCLNFIAGVEAGYWFSAGSHGLTLEYCMPSQVSQDQMVKVVQKYLADNPSKLHLSAEQLIVFALNDAFPCLTPAKPKK